MLHVITRAQRRGAETSAVELAAQLDRRGHQTRVVALAPGTPPMAGVPALGPRTLGPGTLRALRSCIRGADVVVAHGSRTLPAVAIAATGLRCPLVYQNIGDPLYWASSRGRRWRVRRLLGRMTAIGALTDASARALAEDFAVPPERIRVLPNMRDGQRFRPPTAAERQEARRRYGITSPEPVVAVVGALTPEKRVDLALGVAAERPGLRLLIAGEGSERPALETLGARLSPGAVQFVGNVEDVVGVLHASDVLLMTSDSEGVPGVLIEAGLSGVPAVTRGVGYVAEVVVDGQTGRVVDSGDPRVLAEAVDQALGQRDAWGTAARERCASRFDTLRVSDQWSALVEDLSAGH